MTILEFVDEYYIETDKQLDLGTGIVYWRSIIFNTHEYIKSDKLKEARLNLLIEFDKVYGTSLDDRKY